MGLSNEQTVIEANKLFDMCFNANSLADRIVYILSVKYNMVKFGEYFHKNISHIMPVWADQIEEFAELRNDIFYRGLVPAHKEDYLRPSEALDSFSLMISDIEKQCRITLHTAEKVGDEGWEDMLRDFNFKRIAPMLKQGMTFAIQMKQYEDANDIHKWNNDYESWIVPGFENSLVFNKAQEDD